MKILASLLRSYPIKLALAFAAGVDDFDSILESIGASLSPPKATNAQFRSVDAFYFHKLSLSSSHFF